MDTVKRKVQVVSQELSQDCSSDDEVSNREVVLDKTTSDTPKVTLNSTTIKNDHAVIWEKQQKYKPRKAMALVTTERTPLQIQRGALHRQKMSLDEGMNYHPSVKESPLRKIDSRDTPSSSFDKGSTHGSIHTIPDDIHHSPHCKKRHAANGQSAMTHDCQCKTKDKMNYVVIEDQSHKYEDCCSDNSILSCCSPTGTCPTIVCFRRKIKPPIRKRILDPEVKVEKEPLKKRLLRPLFTSVYILLALVAVVVTYSMVQDLINSMQNPVRSIHYHKVKNYTAPGKLVSLLNFKVCLSFQQMRHICVFINHKLNQK